MSLIDIPDLEKKVEKLVEECRQTVYLVEYSKKYSIRKDWNISDKELSEKINAALGSIITMSINEMIFEELILKHGSTDLLESIDDLQSRCGKIVKGHFDELSGSPKKKAKDPAKEAVLILEYLNKARKNINSRLKEFPADQGILKYIRARLKEKKTFEDCIKVIDYKCKQWKKKPGSGKNMEPYLRPKTLFSSENFSNYLVEAESEEQEEKFTNGKSIEGWMK